MASTILGALALLPLISALPQATNVVGPPPKPWVTVDTHGVGITIVPEVATVNGAVTTHNAPPASLLVTATHTISPSGRASTYTGLAPVQTVAGPDDAGTFLACTDYQSSIAPFCQPRDGAIMYPGENYYINWQPSNFADPSTLVEVQMTYDAGSGLTSGVSLPVAIGFDTWRIPADFLTKLGVNRLNVTFWLVHDDLETAPATDIKTLRGPSVWFVNERPPRDTIGTGGRGVNPVVVAVPIVIALVVLGLVGFCFWRWRRTGSVPVLGGLVGAKRASGYGERQSRSERTGTGAAPVVVGDTKAGVGIQLTDRDSWSPTAGRNVFREEVQRQERER